MNLGKNLFFISIFASSLCGEENEELAKISEAMGHLIGKNLQSLGLPLDIDALVRGMQESSKGKKSPMSEEECIEALSCLQEKSLAKASSKNLEEAAEFLASNRTKEGMVVLEDGKLQYLVVKKGEGKSVESYSKPLIRYQGRCLNGPSIPLVEEFLDLDETIPGFQKSLVGMKEGEIRTLYVHPELGFGEQPHPMPNALLIFELELIKADASLEAHAASNDSGPEETLIKHL